MLMLSRCKDDVVMIGKDIRVMVVEVRGGKVRLGIEAPKDVEIVRDDAKRIEPRARK